MGWARVVAGVVLLLVCAACRDDGGATTQAPPSGPHRLGVDGPSVRGAARVPTTITFTATAGDLVSLADARTGDVQQQCPTYALDGGAPEPGVHKVPFFEVPTGGEHTLTYTPCGYRAATPVLTLSSVAQVDLEDGDAHRLELTRPGQQAIARWRLARGDVDTLLQTGSTLAAAPLAAVEVVPPGTGRGDFLTISWDDRFPLAEGIADPLTGLTPTPGEYVALAGGRPGETGEVTLRLATATRTAPGETIAPPDAPAGILATGHGTRGQWLVPTLPGWARAQWWRAADGEVLGGNPVGALRLARTGEATLLASTRPRGAPARIEVTAVDAGRLPARGTVRTRIDPGRPFVATLRTADASLRLRTDDPGAVRGAVNVADADTSSCPRNVCAILLRPLDARHRAADLAWSRALDWVVVLTAQRPTRVAIDVR